jgi:hypothetical protein
VALAPGDGDLGGPVLLAGGAALWLCAEGWSLAFAFGPRRDDDQP